MARNDEVVLGIPHVQCPSCGCTFDLSKNRFDKFTKAQRKLDKLMYGPDRNLARGVAARQTAGI